MRGRGGRELNLWRGDARGYRALMGQVFGRVAAGTVVAIALALADPSGAVANLQNPVTSGVLMLVVQATESEGVGLRSASAYVDGQLKSIANFADDACRGETPTCPAFVNLNVETGEDDLADGVHELDVVIEDRLGRTFNVPRESFERNAKLP